MLAFNRELHCPVFALDLYTLGQPLWWMWYWETIHPRPVTGSVCSRIALLGLKWWVMSLGNIGLIRGLLHWLENYTRALCLCWLCRGQTSWRARMQGPPWMGFAQSNKMPLKSWCASPNRVAWDHMRQPLWQYTSPQYAEGTLCLNVLLLVWKHLRYFVKCIFPLW